MKKLLFMFVAAASAALAFCGSLFAVEDVSAATNTSLYAVAAYADEMSGTATSTNLVVAYEIEETSYEPCACPDGRDGCLVMHKRRVRRSKLERAVSDAQGVFVLESKDCEVMLEWMASRSSGDIAAVALPCDSSHPVGFVDLRAVRDAVKRKGANGSNP